MPWTEGDVDKHIKGLSPEQKAVWVKVANHVLKDCLARNGTDCEGKAIRIANSTAKSHIQGEALKAAEEILLQADMLGYWRAPTPKEIVYGDLDRVRSEFDRAEVMMTEAGAPLVKRIVKEVMAQALAMVKADNVRGLTTLTAPHTGALAAAFRKQGARVVEMGRQQVLQARKRWQGRAFAMPRKRPLPGLSALGGALDARFDIDAERVGADIVNAARTSAMSLEAWWDRFGGTQVRQVTFKTLEEQARIAGLRSLTAVAVAQGRQAYGYGRFIAIEEVMDDIAYVISSAILDHNTCDWCRAQDGREFPPEAALQIPWAECEGQQWGNTCRCGAIVVFKTEWASKPLGGEE